MTNTQLTEFDQTLLDLHDLSLINTELFELTVSGHDSHLITSLVLEKNTRCIKKTMEYICSIKDSI